MLSGLRFGYLCYIMSVYLVFTSFQLSYIVHVYCIMKSTHVSIGFNFIPGMRNRFQVSENSLTGRAKV